MNKDLIAKIFQKIKKTPTDITAYEDLFALCRNIEQEDFTLSHSTNEELRNALLSEEDKKKQESEEELAKVQNPDRRTGNGTGAETKSEKDTVISHNTTYSLLGFQFSVDCNRQSGNESPPGKGLARTEKTSQIGRTGKSGASDKRTG